LNPLGTETGSCEVPASAELNTEDNTNPKSPQISKTKQIYDILGIPLPAMETESKDAEQQPEITESSCESSLFTKLVTSNCFCSKCSCSVEKSTVLKLGENFDELGLKESGAFRVK